MKADNLRILKLPQTWVIGLWTQTSVFSGTPCTIHRIANCSWRDEWRAKAVISDKNSKQIIIPVKVFKLLLKFTSCQNIGVSFSENGNIMFIPTQAVRDLMTENRRPGYFNSLVILFVEEFETASLYWLFAPDLPQDPSSGGKHVGFSKASLARDETKIN